MTGAARPRPAYCNCLAQERGLDPVGTAADVDTIVLLEIPLPWREDIYDGPGALPAELFRLYDLWAERYKAGQPYSQYALMIAPDKVYSRPGFRRVLHFSRPLGPKARFERLEYHVPEGDLGALTWALFEDPEALAAFESYRVQAEGEVRDLLVCTHGTVDAACAKFGFPLYRTLREGHADDALRVWRVSHFGGHVFAPTLVDMPTGHFWAYIDEVRAAQLASRSGDVTALYGCYRGWSGLASGYVQAAERELWQRYGWDWFDYHKSGHVFAESAEGETPGWADVEIAYTNPNTAETGTWRVRVELASMVETQHSTASDKTYTYPQFVVRVQERLE